MLFLISKIMSKVVWLQYTRLKQARALFICATDRNSYKHAWRLILFNSLDITCYLTSRYPQSSTIDRSAIDSNNRSYFYIYICTRNKIRSCLKKEIKWNKYNSVQKHLFLNDSSNCHRYYKTKPILCGN